VLRLPTAWLRGYGGPKARARASRPAEGVTRSTCMDGGTPAICGTCDGASPHVCKMTMCALGLCQGKGWGTQAQHQHGWLVARHSPSCISTDVTDIIRDGALDGCRGGLLGVAGLPPDAPGDGGTGGFPVEGSILRPGDLHRNYIPTGQTPPDNKNGGTLLARIIIRVRNSSGAWGPPHRISRHLG
jgi:hypothetical protein